MPDQGCGEKAVKNENLDAEWFANEICNQIPKAINKNFKFSERPYSVNWAHKGKVEKYDSTSSYSGLIIGYFMEKISGTSGSYLFYIQLTFL